MGTNSFLLIRLVTPSSPHVNEIWADIRFLATLYPGHRQQRAAITQSFCSSFLLRMATQKQRDELREHAILSRKNVLRVAVAVDVHPYVLFIISS